jgi:subtilase family serine protease
MGAALAQRQVQQPDALGNVAEGSLEDPTIHCEFEEKAFMEAVLRKGMGVHGLRLGVIVAVLAFSCQLASAQQTTALSGDHVSGTQYTTELAANQQLQLEVIMALNHRDQLAQLETALQDRDSPSYHQWLTPQQFADRFGPTTQQMQAVANWLASQGLQVTSMDRLTRTVHFAGLYSEVKKALATKILTDGKGYGNTSDPQIPSALASTIVSIEGLRVSSATVQQSQSDAIVSSCTEPAGCDSNPYFGPGDFYTFYDETSVINGGNLGTSGTANSGDCVAIPENASINTVALTNFVNQFQGLPSPLPSPGVLPPIIYTAVNVPVNGATPVSTPGLPTDNEPYLDIEWVHAVSPNTPIRVCYDNGSYLNTLQYIVLDNKCGAISSSIEGGCEPVPTILAIDDVEAQATAQGQTFFKSSGDYGSNWTCGSPIPTPLPPGSPDQQPYNQSSCGHGPYTDANGNTYQPSIDEEASSPNITVVGGTEFQPSYDSNGNDTSVVSEGLESAWNNNDTQGSSNCPTKDASGGGPSVIFNKPAWQTGAGVPNDSARDVPDVAAGADGPLVGVTPALALPGFFVSTQKTTDPNPTFALTGGTSIATPMWAGVSRLIAQAQGVTRLGNINARLYELGNLQSAASGLHDITAGTNDNNGIPGYSAGAGYDLVTGWGSPDIARLVAAFPGAVASPAPVTTTVKAGATAAAGSFTVTNTTSGTLLLQSITVALSAPRVFSSMTLTAAVGTTTPQVASSVPAAMSVFTFSPPVSIPSSGSAAMTLQGVAASNSSAAGITIGTGAGGDRMQSGGGNSLLFGSLVLAAALLLIGPRRRMTYAFAAMLLLGSLATVTTSCGGSSSGSGGSSSRQTSSQSIPQGGINLSDGQGGIIEVSQLPATLGTVTVRF